MILEIKNLYASFLHSSHFCLSDVSLSIAKRQKVALVGESGSGKSMLAQMILRLQDNIAIQSGEICFNHCNILTLNPKNLRALRGKDIAYIPQEPLSSLNPLHKCGKQILESFYIHADELYPHLRGKALYMKAQEKLEEILESVGLDTHFAQSYPFELSGGQKQRVAIARAIVRKPNILLLDEPTSALDKSSQKLILRLLLQLQEQLDMSYIFITHDLEILRALSDEILILHKGRVVEQGASKEVFVNPQNAYAKSLIEEFFKRGTNDRI